MPADEVYYEVATQRFGEQMARVDKLDTKIATMFGFAATLLPLFGALVAIFQTNSSDVSSYLYVAGLFVYLLLLAVTGRAYALADWRFDPPLDVLRDTSATYDNATMRIWVANERVQAMVANEDKLRSKTLAVGIAIVLLAVDVLLLSLASAIAIL